MTPDYRDRTEKMATVKCWADDISRNAFIMSSDSLLERAERIAEILRDDLSLNESMSKLDIEVEKYLQKRPDVRKYMEDIRDDKLRSDEPKR
jgi:hypothetical protein